MSNNKNDTQLRDKLSSLDTLSGGFVYGKEEAWDKLQQRMERKPARRIVLKYGLAAAAVLLLTVPSLVIYFSGNTHLENKTAAKIPAPRPILLTDQPAHQQLVAQPETMPLYTSAKSSTASTKKSTLEHTQTKSIPATDIYEHAPEPVVATRFVVQTPPPPAAPPPMRVVHINELESSSPQATHQIVSIENETIDFKKMPVLYIDDVIKNEYEIKSLLKENRMSFGRNLFSRRVLGYDNTAVETSDAPPGRNLLKNLFNTQN